MESTQIELFLLKSILFLFALLVLSFVYRTIKIISTKKIEDKDDVYCVIFWIAFLMPFVFISHYFKEKFKK
jgi:hypothetical protein